MKADLTRPIMNTGRWQTELVAASYCHLNCGSEYVTSMMNVQLLPSDFSAKNLAQH
jgi:hypothetical protein